MSISTEIINGLTCHVVDDLAAGMPPHTIVVLCHGFGASGTDLVPFGQMMLQHSEIAANVQFLFPEAPISLEDLGMYDSRAWWPIDLRRLQMAVALRTFRELRNDYPPELPVARELLIGLIRQWSDRVQVPLSRFILGGFSQGAMLATEVTLSLDENPAGLVILSGTLLNEDVWRERATHHKSLRVLQSHGTDDPILPFVAANWLRDILKNGGADVEFLQFPGGHEIPIKVVNRLTQFVGEASQDARSHI